MMAQKSKAIQRRCPDSRNPKKVAGINRNRRPLSTGIGGQFEPESVATLGRNMQCGFGLPHSWPTQPKIGRAELKPA